MNMRNYTNLILTAFFFAIFSDRTFAQEIVVNEYFNDPSQNNEWTELVVVKDNLDLTGWFLGDNNQGTDSWQPKIKFTTNALWKNLRAGTVIIIDHASNNTNCNDATDVDKSDGFIRVCCRNTTYFEGGSTTTLFIADAGDFIHIVDPTGKMVHGIGHDDDPGSSVEGGNCFTTSANWTNINSARSATRPCGNFTYYRFQMTAPASLIMLAGTTSDFSSGMQTNETNPFIVPSETAFEGTGNGGNNNVWLTELRMPDILQQSVCMSRTGSANETISFTWEKATDAFPSDNTTGYMVVRNETNDFPLPAQGVEYALNATFGTGNQTTKVVGIINNSQTTTFQENPGPGTFFYRVYAFRYKNTVGFQHPTRGRTYNTQEYVKVNSDIGPTITVINDTLCAPGQAVFVARVESIPVPGVLNWYSSSTGGTPILFSSDTLKRNITQNTSFWVQLESASICSNIRYEVKAVIIKPICEYVAPDSVCEGTPAIFIGNSIPGTTYQWNLISSPPGVKTSRSDSVAYVVSIPSYPDSRKIYFRVRSINQEGCRSDFVGDSVYTVPFDPAIVASKSQPFAGDTVVYTIQSNKPENWVSTWVVSNGDPIISSPFDCKVLASGDSVRVQAEISTVLPFDGLFCKVNRELKLPVKPVVVIEPLRTINNLISANGDNQNPVLDFDRREVKNLEIFNRWGKKVNSYSSYRNDWRPGTSDLGIYFYSAEVKEPDASDFQKVTGWVEVVE